MAYSSLPVLDMSLGLTTRNVSLPGTSRGVALRQFEAELGAIDVARQREALSLESYSLNIIETKGARFADWAGENKVMESDVNFASYQVSLTRLLVYAILCVASFGATSLLLSSGLYSLAVPAGIVFGVSLILTLVWVRIHLSEHSKLTDRTRRPRWAARHAT